MAKKSRRALSRTRTARFRKRSQAAKRGWETRRKNARKHKRTGKQKKAASKNIRTRSRRARPRDTGDIGGMETARPKHYRDLDDWIAAFDSWDGEYDTVDYDTGVDTGGAD